MTPSKKRQTNQWRWLVAAIAILVTAMIARVNPSLVDPIYNALAVLKPAVTSSATTSTQTSTQIPLPKSDYAFNSNGRIGLGVYLEQALENNLQPVQDFERLIQHKLEYVLLFRAWGDSDKHFPLEIFPYLKSLQLTPVFTWEPWKRDFVDPAAPQPEYSLKTIIDGEHDTYIREWAKGAAAANHPLVIRFGHEMTTKPGTRVWYPWQGRPNEYIAAFRHVVNIFREEGATKTKFLWNPIYFTDVEDVVPYYPGDAYVDIVGFTIINIGDLTGLNHENYDWRSCHQLFDLQFTSIKNINKPVLIVEMLSSEFGGSKAQWYGECFAEMQQRQSIIGAISYQKAGELRWSNTAIDWRVDSSNSSYRAFLVGINTGFIK
jgi:beta-mannanase